MEVTNPCYSLLVQSKYLLAVTVTDELRTSFRLSCGKHQKSTLVKWSYYYTQLTCGHRF